MIFVILHALIKVLPRFGEFVHRVTSVPQIGQQSQQSSRSSFAVTWQYSSMSEEVGDSRQYDIVVFGATGYTGQFVNEELYKIQGEGKRALKWAAAGRSQSKLEACLKGMCLASN